MRLTLHRHAARPHVINNANDVHSKETEGFSERLAEWLTDHVGSMACILMFCGIGVGSLVGVYTNNTILAASCGAVSSYFLQLVLLAVIQKGTNIQARRTQIQSDEMYKGVMNSEHHEEQMIKHLSRQDTVIIGTLVSVLGLIAWTVVWTVPQVWGKLWKMRGKTHAGTLRLD